jgi:hypothetical protein
MSEERNGPGRPPVDRNGSNEVRVKVPNSEYDEACTLADEHEMSVPEVLRIGLSRLLASVRAGEIVLRRGRI